MSSVEVIVINWKRPDNVVKILEALKNQSHSCTITVVDCSTDFPKLSLIDNLYHIQDYGPFSRFVPAMNCVCDYTLFIDDDILPEKELIECFVKHAESKPNDLLGLWGRRLDKAYDPTNIPRGKDFVKVDMLVRIHWMPTKHLCHLMKFRQIWSALYPGNIREDDMILAFAIKTYTENEIYLIPDQEGLICELPEPYSSRSNPDHHKLRTNFWNNAKFLSNQMNELKMKEVFFLCYHMPQLGGYEVVSNMPIDVRRAFINEFCRIKTTEYDAMNGPRTIAKLFRDAGGSGYTKGES